MTTPNFSIVTITKPEEVNFILGQSHFIKTVEDIHEALITTVPNIKFGLAFCEASGPRLIRTTGTDPNMIKLASDNAQALSCGHCFVLFLAPGFYPINILNTLKTIPEIVGFFCATANPTQVIVAQTDQGRGIMGVIDGGSSLGIEADIDITERKNFLRKIGYKQ